MRNTIRALLTLTAPCAAAAAMCASAGADPATLSPADARSCGAFSAINNIAQESLYPSRNPAGYVRPEADYIALANALNVIDKTDVSDDMNAALTDYVYTLTKLGAAVNSNEPVDSFEIARAEREMTNRCGPESGYPAGLGNRDRSAFRGQDKEATPSVWPDKRKLPDGPAPGK